MQQTILQTIHRPPPYPITANELIQSASLWVQTKQLFRRAFFNEVRNPQVMSLRIFGSSFLATFIALVFINVNNPGSPAYAVFQNISGALFFIVINQLFTSMNSVLSVYGAERVSP